MQDDGSPHLPTGKVLVPQLIGPTRGSMRLPDDHAVRSRASSLVNRLGRAEPLPDDTQTVPHVRVRIHRLTLPVNLHIIVPTEDLFDPEISHRARVLPPGVLIARRSDQDRRRGDDALKRRARSAKGHLPRPVGAS